tara:strand:+ start:444 stop:590 length:147 start_codon:yes stop_codon:yes gene_type:complete
MSKKEKSLLRKKILDEEMRKNLLRRRVQKKNEKDNNLYERKINDHNVR